MPVDYLVLTVPVSEVELPVLKTKLAKGLGVEKGAKPALLYGARGVKGEYGFIGYRDYDSRIVISSSGSRAHTVSLFCAGVLGERNISVARMDIQETIAVENADRAVLQAMPSKRYKSLRYASVYGAGATLYVGAPSSDARFRYYNKTAESGLRSEDGKELLRYEIQLRNRYADIAWEYLRLGDTTAILLQWTRKMVDDGFTPEMLEGYLRVFGSGIKIQTPKDDDDWIARRKLWFETSVVPALRKLLTLEPEYADVIYSLLFASGDKGKEGS